MSGEPGGVRPRGDGAPEAPGEAAPEAPGDGAPEAPGEAARVGSRVPGPALGTGAAGERRPLIERLGMAVIAVGIALAFGAIAAAFLAGNEPIFAAMAALGGLMTLWAGTVTLIRG